MSYYHAKSKPVVFHVGHYYRVTWKGSDTTFRYGGAYRKLTKAEKKAKKKLTHTKHYYRALRRERALTRGVTPS